MKWQAVTDAFEKARTRPHGERTDFLREYCAGDEELRREAESLLKAYEESGEFLEESAVAQGGRELVDSLPGGMLGARLGVFRITRLIGEGGMGAVYEAERADGEFRQRVAIKIVREDWADRQRHDRFRAERQILSDLSHPHIARLLDGGATETGAPYLVMELIDGEPIDCYCDSRGLKVAQRLELFGKVCEAVEHANRQNVIHCDIKPGNILVTADGTPKLLDFGISKLLSGGTQTTQTCVATPEYASPEQLTGQPVTAATDVYALGVVLRKLAGDEPGLSAVIARATRPQPLERYPSAAALGDAARKALETSLAPVVQVRLSRTGRIAACAVAAVACILAVWLWHRWSRERWAGETATPEIARLLDEGEYVKAAALAREARAVLPKDPALEKLWVHATGEVSFDSVPSEASVSFRPYRGDPNAWATLGKTPLKKVRVARDEYVWRIAKPGFAAMFVIGSPPGEPPPGFHSGFSWKLTLRPEGSVPPEMAVVPRGGADIAYPLGGDRGFPVPGFLIDRHEVTNAEYKKFVNAGGYRKRELWKQPFAKDGHAVSWEEAIALFHDTTGRSGPATWEVGDYPQGRAQHPVAGVSWYEAAAYAEFVGKTLPTAYHWTWASQSPGETPVITSGSNFGREGTQPVGSTSALSGWGTSDMAGNVKEWCWNESRDGKRFVLGGGFGEPDYMFHNTDAQSPWDRRANFGFRCVKLDKPPAPPLLARIEATTRDDPKRQPVSDDVFKAYTALYAYDKGELNAHVEQTEAMEGWSREKVTFDAAYGHERVTAYLFVPKNATRPFQTVTYYPGAQAFLEDKLDLANVEDTRGFLMKSGRALVFPVYKGMYERRDGFRLGSAPPAFLRDHVIAWAKDLGRTLDYLETRKEFDGTKVAYFGDSTGAVMGSLLPAVEKRIKAAILATGGLHLPVHYLPESDPFNFMTHVTIPVLMLNGRYDAGFPLELSQRPLFHFLGTPAKDKKHVVYEGGHGAFPRPGAVRECLDWLDKYLGPVRR